MKNFNTNIQIRWSDLDPNVHLRHSVYYDWGALSRISFLNQQQLSTEVMQRLQIGPIIFREECVFKKEIRFGDEVTIDIELVKGRKDFSRWTIRHTIRKSTDVIAAVITVEGAWIDVAKRKLAVATQEIKDVFTAMPVAEDFQWEGE